MINNWPKKAGKAVRSLKPEIYENPVLSSLEKIASRDAADYDPFLDKENWIDSFTPRHYYAITSGAIADVYASNESIEPLHRAWVESLRPAL